jgi:SAM-dependent methyltransferase
VAEADPRYLGQALRLLQSLRWFGGAQAAAPFAVGLVGEADPGFSRELERLGAELWPLARYSPRHPHSNKLQLPRHEKAQAFDLVALLDCDTLVVDDPTPFLGGGGLGAKIADTASVPLPLLEAVFARFGRPLPPARHRTTWDRQPTIAYCNAGVLLFSREARRRLLPRWLELHDRLLADLELLGDRAVFCEQVSLSLALAEEPDLLRELPPEMNFPLHLPPEEAPAELLESDARIVHYHWKVNAADGLLQETPFPRVQARLAAFNQRLAREWRRGFSNARFWNERYFTNPELGSGLGSRGAPLAWKRALLARLVAERRPASLLDVGCGDGEATAELALERFLGIDVAERAIELARRRFPRRRFAAGDFLELEVEAADFCLCLDVLIHQPDPEVYRALARKLVARTRRFGVVSGYQSPPEHPSPITFFHEPLAQTLRRCGAREVHRIGSYRETEVLLYTADAREPGADRPGVGEEPLFLVGALRSGTTLLAEQLGSHPEIVYCPFELKALWSRVGGCEMASPRTGDARCPSCGAAQASPARARALEAAFLGEYRSRSAGKRAGARLLNKNPHLCNKLPFARALFPGARFLLLTRSLPAVAHSLRGLFAHGLERHGVVHSWPERDERGGPRCWHCHPRAAVPSKTPSARRFPGGDPGFLAEYWLESNAALEDFSASAAPGTVLRVEHEDLVREPAEGLARIQGWLGLSLEELSGPAVEPGRSEAWRAAFGPRELGLLRDFAARHDAGQPFLARSRAALAEAAA